MNLNKIEFRNEKKLLFLEPENYLDSFFKYLKFNEIFYKRKINTIYFETNNLDDLLDTINGEKSRSKLRFRWYGKTFNSSAKPVLENKIKINNQNYKIKQNLNEFNFSDSITIQDIEDNIKSTYIADDKTFTKYKVRKPNIFISYFRKYYKYKNIRITLDTRLKSNSFYRKKKIFKNDFLREKKFSIVEIKYLDKDFEDVKKLSKKFKNRFTKFSKYENALIGS